MKLTPILWTSATVQTSVQLKGLPNLVILHLLFPDIHMFGAVTLKTINIAKKSSLVKITVQLISQKWMFFS